MQLVVTFDSVFSSFLSEVPCIVPPPIFLSQVVRALQFHYIEITIQGTNILTVIIGH